MPQRRLRRIGGRSCSVPILRFLSEREFGYCVGSAHHHEGTPAEEEVTAAGPQESHAETAALHCEARAGPPPERPGCNQAIDAMGMPLVTVWDIRERMPLSSSTAACSAVMFSSRLVCMACGIHCCQIVQRARAALPERNGMIQMIIRRQRFPAARALPALAEGDLLSLKWRDVPRFLRGKACGGS